MRTSMNSGGAGLRVSQRRSLSDRTLRVTFEEQGSLGISFAPQRADDAGGGDRIMVTAVQEGSLASIYKADGLAEGAVLLEVQGKQVEGGQFERALTLLQQCLNVRPLTLEFRLDTAHATILDLPRTESEDGELTAVPFALEHTAVAELGLKFASQLDGFGESAEHVVVIHEVAEGALTTTVRGESLTAVPGMVLNGVSGRPIAGRTFEDVMDMIANSMLVASLVEKAEAPAQTNLVPESPALPHRTPQGDLVRPAPPLPHRAWDGSLTSASAGACVLEFDALLNKSGKLEPRVLPRLLSIQLMSSEPARVLFAEVPRTDAADKDANTGAMVVVHQLDYGSEAIVELAEAGLCEGMVLRAVNGTPVHGAGAAKSESEDDTPPYTVHEVEEVLKMGPRPLTLSFEGEFDEETAQLLPRLVSVPVSADSQLLFASQTGGMVQRTFEVKRGSLSKGIHLRLGDMAIQVEARNGGWQSFLYEKLDRVEVRGRKLVIRMQGTAGAPTVLRCQGDDAREIAKDVETKIRQLRAASRASSLVALRSSGGRDTLPQVAEGVETEAETDVSPRVSPQVGPFSGGAAVEPLKLEPADPEPGSAPATPEKTLATTPLARQPSGGGDGGTPGATPRTLDALLMKAQAKHSSGDETQRKRATSEISEASSSAPSSPRAGSEASEEPVSPHPAEGVPNESVWATVADMKSLYEVPQLEQSALFAKKMRLCTCAEGAEGVPAAVVSACQLEMMKDLKDFVLVKGVFSSQDSPNLFELGLDLIAARLIRPVAPVEEDFFDVDESLGDEDEEDDDEGGTPVAGSRAAVTVRTDPEWPMLELVYEFACKMLNSNDVPTAKAAISLSRHASEGGGSCSGRRLLTQLVPLLEDAGKQERQWIIKLLKLLVSRFGRTKLRRVVKILLEGCGNACLTLAYDSAVQRHRGLAEVLDLAQALIEQWRPPMLEYQATFIIRSLGALHTLPVDNISPHHEVLKECQFAAIEKDEAYPLPLPVVQNLLKMWPRQNTEKEELFLEELEGLLAFLAPADIMVVGKQVAARLVSSLRSPHVEVMKGALYLLVSEDVDAVLADTAAAVGAGEGGETERAVVETMFQKLTGAVPVNDPKRRFNEEVMELLQDVRESLARHRMDCLGEDDDDEFYQ